MLAIVWLPVRLLIMPVWYFWRSLGEGRFLSLRDCLWHSDDAGLFLNISVVVTSFFLVPLAYGRDMSWAFDEGRFPESYAEPCPWLWKDPRFYPTF